MTRRIAIQGALLLGALLMAAPLPAAQHGPQDATTAEEVRRSAAQTYQLLKQYTIEQRDEAMAAAADRLERLDVEIDALQADLDRRWDRMAQTTREQTRETLHALQQQRQEVAEWYGSMRHSSSEAWDEVKKGFAASYDRLEQAFRKASREFSGDR